MKNSFKKVSNVDKEKRELKKVLIGIIDSFEIETAVDIIKNACHAFYLIHKEKTKK